MYYLYCIRLYGFPIYVGVTKNPLSRFKSHRFAKTSIRRIVRKYRDNVEFQILVTGARDYIYDLEVKAIAIFGTRKPNGFNCNAGGWGCRDPLPLTRAKISKASKARISRPVSTETRAKISAANKGRKFSEEHKRKLSLARMGNTNNLGNHHSDATKLKLSAAGSNRRLSSEHKAKLAIAGRRRIWTAESRAKLSISKLGHVVSPETRAKISATRKQNTTTL